jgi:hypothetical protein
MKYLFQTEVKGGWLQQSNPHKRHLQHETQDIDGVPTRVPLNEIRESELAYDSATETLRIVSDEIAVVPRSEQPVKVPQSVTRRGLRKALGDAGITMADIKVEVDKLTPAKKRRHAQIDLEDSTEFGRQDGIPKLIVTELGKSEVEMDAIFVEARKLGR